MCGGEYEGGFRSGTWRRARTQKPCYACKEAIRPGDLYHREVGRDDGDLFCYNHCARCWKMLSFLIERADGDSVAYDLNCGETYEYRADDDPAYALAFLTPDEAQSWAHERKGKRPWE